jgi:hypothetical protein
MNGCANCEVLRGLGWSIIVTRTVDTTQAGVGPCYHPRGQTRDTRFTFF